MNGAWSVESLALLTGSILREALPAVGKMSKQSTSLHWAKSTTMPYSDLLIASVAIAILYVAYRTVHAIYHLYFHPLAKFPGPRAAVLSGDWLYRVSQEGNPEGTFAELHRAYGEYAQISRTSTPITC
jgi:hypothetical protein